MDPTTGREFNFPNPQDDPQDYPNPPGWSYDFDGNTRKEVVPVSPEKKRKKGEEDGTMSVSDIKTWMLSKLIEPGCQSEQFFRNIRGAALNLELEIAESKFGLCGKDKK